MKKCPFLEEVIVRYCKAYPIKKLIPPSTSDTNSICLNNGYVKCSKYRDVAKVKSRG
ncbi:MAG: hypothetical protein QMD71_02445 [bacterium]|nr:hypothetical protein [bacterium]